MFRLWYQMRLTWRLIRDPRVPLMTKFVPLLAVIYILSPLDLIPDIIIGLGQLDDIGILLLSMRALEMVAPQEVVAEHRAYLSGKVDENVIEVTDYTVSYPDDSETINNSTPEPDVPAESQNGRRRGWRRS